MRTTPSNPALTSENWIKTFPATSHWVSGIFDWEILLSCVCTFFTCSWWLGGWVSVWCTPDYFNRFHFRRTWNAGQCTLLPDNELMHHNNGWRSFDWLLTPRCVTLLRNITTLPLELTLSRNCHNRLNYLFLHRERYFLTPSQVVAQLRTALLQVQAHFRALSHVLMWT